MANSQFDQPIEPSANDNRAFQENHKRLFLRGKKCLSIGILLMAVSFAINFVLFHGSGDFKVLMYALTSVGAVFIMVGLGCILW